MAQPINYLREVNMSGNNSICIKVCEYEETGKYCKGCNRSAEEIEEWFYASQDRKKEIARAARARGKERKRQ